MASDFPVALPGAKTDYDNTDNIASADQNAQGEDINALGAKVGKDSSAVTTSHDYKLSGVTGTDKAVSKTGTETLTNKTLTSPTITGPTITGTIGGTPTITTPVISSLYQDAGKTKLMTIPNTASDTLVTLAATQNLSNKTFTDQTEFSEDINLATGKNVQVNDVDPWKTISLDARAWQPTTTSGCAAVVTVEAGTNDIDYDVLDFATDADENAFCNIWMPGNWDAGVIQFRYVWTNAGGGAAETVTFEFSGRSYSDDDAIDQAVGTAVEVADTWIAQGDIHYSDWSGDVTITGATAGEWVHLELMRDVSQDDLTGDARLVGVQIRYKESQYNHY